jgi:hypothetical protein
MMLPIEKYQYHRTRGRKPPPAKHGLDRPAFAPVMMKSDFERGDLIVLFLAAKPLLEMSMIFTYLP